MVRQTDSSAVSKDDTELVSRLKTGEPDALVELYNCYFERIYWMVINQVDGDRDAAQDVVQETFLAALKSVGRFRGQSKVYTWLYSIASRQVADFYRRQKRKDRHEAGSLGEDVCEPVTSETAESEETKRAIQEILSSLPLHYKQVLLLKYVEEMPVTEICQVMGRSSKSVEGLLTRARRELRDRITVRNEG